MSGMGIGWNIIETPFLLLFFLWTVSPIVFVTWRMSLDTVWIIAFFVIAMLGSLAIYDMAYRPGSSTDALGFIFMPALQWAAGALIALDRRIAHRDHQP
ncbi:hypothetical protein [Paraurantiacibacter namhicola]|uniref:hypothetical protein n=1 Tax=Paraurantiacibacter namhicola TaxID=645517 RepID=UPI000836F8B0|nr:hypothetical protein [Paraurantiacibacter namhicola]